MELIGELSPPIDWATTIQDIRSPVACCAWSKQRNLFAWNGGNNVARIVKIIYNIDESISFSAACSINAKDLIYSLAFGQPSDHLPFSSKAKPKYIYNHFVDILLAVGLSNGRIRAYDAETGCAKLELMDHRMTVNDLNFCNKIGFRLLSASFDSTLKVWDMDDDGNMTATIRTPFSKVFSAIWSTDDSMIVAVGDKKQVCIWSGSDYGLLFKILGHSNSISQCCFSSDSSLLLTSSFDMSAVVWDVNALIPVTTFHHVVPQPSLIFCGGVNGNYVISVSISKDNQYVATVDENGKLRLWDIDFPDEYIDIYYSKHGGSCQFSPHGKFLAYAQLDGHILFFKIKIENVPRDLQKICRQVIRQNFLTNQISTIPWLPKRLINYILYIHKSLNNIANESPT